jgi:hypothetical protein
MKKIIRTLVSKKRAKIFCENMVYNIEPRRGIRTFSKCRFPSCLAPREPEPSRAGEMWIHAYQEQIYLYRHHFQMWLCVCLWSNSFFSFLPPSLFPSIFCRFSALFVRAETTNSSPFWYLLWRLWVTGLWPVHPTDVMLTSCGLKWPFTFIAADSN